MKKYILLVIIILFAGNMFAQETIKQKDRLTASVIEDYNVLKTDKQTKQGRYMAVFERKTALAFGDYTNNQKTGIWRFFDTGGKLTQIFDYNRSMILYEEPADSLNQTKIMYVFDTKFKDTDYVTKPIKIGGRCYGYIPYLKFYVLPQDFYNIDPSQIFAVLEVLVSPGGRLAEFKIHIKYQGDEWITTFSPELIDEEDKIFVPATLNHEPILSRIFIKCSIGYDSRLDVY